MTPEGRIAHLREINDKSLKLLDRYSSIAHSWRRLAIFAGLGWFLTWALLMWKLQP